ncbi:MAG: tRNA (adenosine(37)-N6)-threonylcarbamoyltransferase complex dimerization subunit type 1 TsaB [Propionibacteriaceae bacterium]|nr:tRNA (adenosine(37)-N6)-threonylcarbamoyltransferase complex dimerization subunit type 1 TsaB [Propionibacteriaceae bacterium]
MTAVLGLDTSTVVVAGLAVAGRAPLTAVVDDTRAHAEELMPLVRQLLASAALTPGDLTGIVVGVGPGPFTGLRVGVVTALTLGEVLGVGVHGVCSLDVVAAQWAGSGAPDEFVVVSDARRKEVYWAHYARGVRVDGPHVSPADRVPPLPLGGPGAHLVGEPSGPTVLDAATLVARGLDLPDAGREPLYLRRPDAEVPGAPKSALPQARLGFGRRP